MELPFGVFEARDRGPQRLLLERIVLLHVPSNLNGVSRGLRAGGCATPAHPKIRNSLPGA
jgi:hypothetical protein